MTKFVNSLYKNQALFYKVFLFALTAVLIVYLLPKGGKFKYEIPKGKPWQYENLYAPFDFAILKTEEEIQAERQEITQNHTPYFQLDETVLPTIKEQAIAEIELVFTDSILNIRQKPIEDFVNSSLDKLYENGILQESNRLDPDQLVYLRRGNEAFEVPYKRILKLNQVRDFLNSEIEDS
ncbi:MAG TPA: hypothetical protein VLO29_00320, partial [Salegentibacter sp.]|nr:hypothetical protein [Salegentibacter sp.]